MIRSTMDDGLEPPPIMNNFPLLLISCEHTEFPKSRKTTRIVNPILFNCAIVIYQLQFLWYHHYRYKKLQDWYHQDLPSSSDLYLDHPNRFFDFLHHKPDRKQPVLSLQLR